MERGRGARLKFPTGASVTTNAASVTLAGAGATIAALGGAATNNASLTVTGDAALTTSGNLSNTANLTVGAGSTIAVGGARSQTPAGTLNEGISGTPASGQFGKLAITGAAMLAGTFHLDLASGFTPPTGSVYPVLTYASAAGTFSSFTGLPQQMTQVQGPTSLNLLVAAASGIDLLPTVTAPTSAAPGEPIAVNWSVTNQGSSAASGSWLDAVYLSPASTITPASVLLGTVQRNGGLNAGVSYNASLTTSVPALVPGNWNVLVVADSHYSVADQDRANNTQAATAPLQVTLPAATLGTPIDGSFTALGQDRYYQVTVPADGSLVLSLASVVSGYFAMYASQGVIPTPYNYQYASIQQQPPSGMFVPPEAQLRLTVPQAVAGATYYILVRNVSGAAATANYTLTAAQSTVLSVSGFGPTTAGNAGKITVQIDGTNFTSKTTASVTRGSTTIDASSIALLDSGRIFATFDLIGAAPGDYALTVRDGALIRACSGCAPGDSRHGGEADAGGEHAGHHPHRPHGHAGHQLHQRNEQRHRRSVPDRLFQQSAGALQHRRQPEQLHEPGAVAGGCAKRPGGDRATRPERPADADASEQRPDRRRGLASRGVPHADGPGH